MNTFLNETFLEDILNPYFLLDENNLIISSNINKSKEINEEMLGKSITSFFSIWEQNHYSELILAKRGNHTYVFIEGNFIYPENKLFIGVKTDELSILRKENTKLKELNRELDAIIENSYDGIYITDAKGKTLRTNSAIERITNIPKEYYMGKNVSALKKRGILRNTLTDKVIELNRTVSVVQENYAGNETLLTGSPVYNDKNEIEKVVTNIRDLSDLNELQMELEKVNKLNDKYKNELTRLKKEPDHMKDIIRESEQMKMIYDTAARIANIDTTVLILGETGVGKDVLANYIFKTSQRSREGELIKVNCGSIPGELLESELFGYESGAFTGASSKGKVGMFELADKGTIFLDEIGELPLALQVKLLRVIQEGEIQRIGGTQPLKIDIRIIAATNRNLHEMVKNGEFREDLYYRLNVIPINLPSLRERKSDILPMIQLFLKQMNEKHDLNKELNYELKGFFLSYHWPGNIRELSNLIERLVVTTRENIITADDLPPEYLKSQDIRINQISSLKDAVESAEKEVISLAAQKYDNTYDIAKTLDSSQATIVRRLKKYGIKVGK